MDSDLVKFIFTYQSPKPFQIQDYDTLGEGFRMLAELVNDCTPAGPGQAVAIRKLAEARMAANAAIALEGKF